jgi:hypothetical protein
MASTYTANNGIEKIGSGEQAGTWGTTTNTNLDIIDRAINGVGSIALTGTASNLTTTDGTLSNGHYKVVTFTGSLSAGHTVTISPNDQDKLYFVYNNSGDTLTFSQGSGANVTVVDGKTSIIYADGAGAGAAVAKIETGSESFTEDITIKTSDGALLTLQTSDTTITDGDVLGALQFQAPDEGDGADGDAQIIAASIIAEADDEFDDDSTATDLVIKLGTTVADDNAAVERMRLTHEGDLNLVTDGKSINFGADSEITLTHVADTGLTLTHTATGAGKPVVLNLKSEEDAIADGDIIGKITFTAGDSDGTDAIATAASIEAEADNTFAADNNQTDMVFKLGSSEAATEKMRLTHEGDLSVSTSFTIGSATVAEAELEQIDGITAGTVAASKAVVVDSNKDASGFRNVTATGTVQGAEVTATSDERLKSDITTIDDALNKVMQMRGVTYTMRAEKGTGVIAQEIEKIIPEVVTTNEYKSVAYGNMVGVLIEAIKDLKKELDEHKQGCSCGSSD